MIRFRSNSSGSCEMSLEVATIKVRLSYSDIQVSKVPKTLFEIPRSFCVKLMSLSVFVDFI